MENDMLSDEIKEYLDGLRESGEINMFSAGPFLELRFNLSKKEAREVLMEWMKTYE